MNASASSSPSRGVTYLYMLAAMTVIVAGLRMAQEILQPFLLAAFISVISVPVYAGLVKRRVAPWLALLMVITAVVGLMMVVLYIVLTSLADFTDRQDHYAEQLRVRTLPLRQKLEDLLPAPAENPGEAEIPAEVEPTDTAPPVGEDVNEKESGSELARSTDEALPDDVGDEDSGGLSTQFFPDTRTAPRNRKSLQQLVMGQFDPATLIRLTASLASSIGVLLSNGVLILLTVVFILLEASSFPSKVERAFGADHATNKDVAATREQYVKVVASARSYIAIKTAISLLTGLLIAVWLWLFGVPYAGLWGLVAFLLNYIPNIGSIIAAIPALLVAWLDLGLLPALACGMGYVVVNVIVGNFIEPRVMGRGMGLSPLVVFCCMVFWGWVLGPVGMLASVPLTMAVRVALEGFDDTRWLGTLLGN